jgi:hypothetical protein
VRTDRPAEVEHDDMHQRVEASSATRTLLASILP